MHRRLILVLGLLLAACGSPTVIAVPVKSDGLTLAPVSVVPLVSTRGEIVQTPAAAAPALALRILSPAPDAVVTVPEVKVVGQAAPGTVLTLNEALLVVDATGEFTVTLPLAEGPNLIEIEASDADGNGTYLEQTVTYEPSN